MALMFLHIPRTGGSTVWHSLARAAGRQGKIVADLYHQSKELTGGPFSPEEATQYFHNFLEKTNLCFDNDVIYHHHTYQHVPYLVESEQLQRVSLLRDPATRLISEAFHMRRFLLAEQAGLAEGQLPSAENLMHRHLYDEKLYEQLIAADIDADELVINFARLHKNYYLSYFSSFLDGNETPGAFDEAAALRLAQKVRSEFVWVGQFPDLDLFINACGLFANLEISSELDMHHVANGSEVPALKEETLAQVKAINSLDYVFVEEVLRGYDSRMIRRLINGRQKLIDQRQQLIDERQQLTNDSQQLTSARQQLVDERQQLINDREQLVNDRQQLISQHEGIIQTLNEQLASQTLLTQSAEQQYVSEAALSRELAENLEHHQTVIQNMQNSVSWRVTKPLRTVRARLKRPTQDR